MRTLVIFLIAVAYATIPVPTKAHEWYPKRCCSGQDCGPAKVIRHNPDGSRVVQRLSDGATVVVPPGFPMGVSQDGELHVCIGLHSKELLCLFDGAGT